MFCRVSFNSLHGYLHLEICEALFYEERAENKVTCHNINKQKMRFNIYDVFY